MTTIPTSTFETQPTMKREELISSLHKIGPLYWHRPDTADCLIKVVKLYTCSHRQLSEEGQRFGATSASMPNSAGPSTSHFAERVSTGRSPTSSHVREGSIEGESYVKRRRLDPDQHERSTPGSIRFSPPHHHLAENRRESAPPATTSPSSCPLCPPRLEGRLYRLHKDFLIVQSSSLSHLLSSPSLSSTESEDLPSIELPLPDPTVFDLFVEYFYLGDFTRLTSAMENGKVSWESVMLNARHLGLDGGLKTKLGGWWRLRSGRPTISSRAGHRGSLPAKSLVGALRTAASNMEDGEGKRRVGGRARAYTTGCKQDDLRERERERRVSRSAAMTPIRAFASGMPLPPPPIPGDTSPISTRKRTRSPGHGSYRSYTSSPYSPSSKQPPTSTPTPNTPLVSYDTSPVASHLTTDHSYYHSEKHNALSEKQEYKEQKPPSAVKQLLLGGNRRRALSNLAYYCSTGIPSSTLGDEARAGGGGVGIGAAGGIKH